MGLIFVLLLPGTIIMLLIAFINRKRKQPRFYRGIINLTVTANAGFFGAAALVYACSVLEGNEIYMFPLYLILLPMLMWVTERIGLGDLISACFSSLGFSFALSSVVTEWGTDPESAGGYLVWTSGIFIPLVSIMIAFIMMSIRHVVNSRHLAIASSSLDNDE